MFSTPEHVCVFWHYSQPGGVVYLGHVCDIRTSRIVATYTKMGTCMRAAGHNNERGTRDWINGRAR
jgi:hypothetical protein